MSRHLVECAGQVTGLRPVEKLLLLCMCDNAGDRDHIALPGLATAMTWTMASRSTTYAAIEALTDLGYLRQTMKAHGTNSGAGKGRRAEYEVFPNGCCERHGAPAVSSERSDADMSRSLSPAQLAARRANVERIAARRRAQSEQSDPDPHHDSPNVRTLPASQRPNETESASEDTPVSVRTFGPRTYRPSSKTEVEVPASTHQLTAEQT